MYQFPSCIPKVKSRKPSSLQCPRHAPIKQPYTAVTYCTAFPDRTRQNSKLVVLVVAERMHTLIPTAYGVALQYKRLASAIHGTNLFSWCREHIIQLESNTA
jgi:hypothetical protein